MNTFGLKRKGINTFWLGLPGVIQDVWEEIVPFILQIKRNIQFYLER
jgi:hypothetical protein